jgi:uncharacterized 2Fe-2S/4Fe-4S cluster protein (DUF4445 family)
MAKIKVQSHGRERMVKARNRTLISDAVLSAGFFIERPCAGRGTCGKCKVAVTGRLNRPSAEEKKALSSEELKSGMRLACQARVMGDAAVKLSSSAVVTDKIFSGTGADLEKLKGPFGIAIDLGTTTVAAFLVTLDDSRIHRGFAVLNRQTVHGAEVISRMESSLQGGSGELKDLARSSIAQAVQGLGLSAGQRRQVERAVVVGNSAMHHLFLGLPVDNLVKLPFQPVERKARKTPYHLFGRQIELWVPPLIGGFVGSDTLAGLIYLGFASTKTPMAAVDLGTNGEVMVSNGREIAVASTAAGPAFEGVNIECGMRASAGAIASVSRGASGKLKLEVIGKGRPLGLAGSGLLSLVNLLRKEGKISASGRLEERFPVADRVHLCQSDVREVQKAKAAVRAAFEILLKRLRLKPSGLAELVLTGSFGARINVSDALELGMIPATRRDRIKLFANAAGMGAGMLLSEEAFEFATGLAERVRHVELHADPEFMDKFVSNMTF